MIKREDLQLEYASSNDPDAIGVGILLRGDLVLGIYLQSNGYRSMTFGRAEGEEFDASDLHELITDCFTELDKWAANLRKPGAPWSNECGDNQS